MRLVEEIRSRNNINTKTTELQLKLANTHKMIIIIMSVLCHGSWDLSEAGPHRSTSSILYSQVLL